MMPVDLASDCFFEGSAIRAGGKKMFLLRLHTAAERMGPNQGSKPKHEPKHVLSFKPEVLSIVSVVLRTGAKYAYTSACR